ncbi:MAG: DUF4932 domain-containing protein [Candidatus Cloacimonetes bacterium]|nr:DUF4932 domain-containing protein [Candidatus Cloacimonadota bacterium]MDY0367973.1 DUF4932 domain-containing protein [Candidatus Syntrophosphaera sp.]
MQIRLDKRMELIFAVLQLSDYYNPGLYVCSDDPQAKLVREILGDHSHLPAVTKLSTVWEEEINWDIFSIFALSLAGDYTLDPVTDTSYLQQFIKGTNSIQRYAAWLRDFAGQSNFDRYYSLLEEQYAPYLRKLNILLDSRPVQAILEDYLGITFPRTELILSTLMNTFMSITHPGREAETVYCLCSRSRLDIAERNKGLERILLSAVWHEFSHHVINPLTFGLFAEPDAISQDQVNWCCELNESIIWAINTRLLVLENIITMKDITWMLENAVKNKAPQTPVMHDLLCEYETKRHIYPSIAEYYPVLLKANPQLPGDEKSNSLQGYNTYTAHN